MVIDYAKKGVEFIRKYPGILSSLILIVLIPLALYANVQFTIDQFDANINTIVRGKAFLTEKVLDTFMFEYVERPDLKDKIREVIESNPEITAIEVLTQKDKELVSAVSIVREHKNLSNQTVQALETAGLLAWQNNEATGFLSTDNDVRQWNVVKPFYDNQNEKVGLVRLTISLQETDAARNMAIRNSYTIMVFAVLLVIILVINHTRFVKFSVSLSKLREVDKMKDEFISMAAHELKTPVVVMKGYAEILQQSAVHLTEEQKMDRLKAIVSYADNLMSLISDILDVSRIEQNRLVLDVRDESPYEVIKEVVDTIQLSAEQKGLVVAYEDKTQLEPAILSIDTKRLRQIMINLVGNAIKYTEKGTIRIGTRIDKMHKRFIISVEDSGLGMSAEAQRSLFQKFYRVKTEHTESIAGTGLGLWITKALCEAMGGVISVESMEGVGSKFIIALPLKKGEGEAI
ncbi:MAG: Histidine kinase [Candidatus Wolfebacteria bacterium GW2011_GWE1_48_7]|uniref:histidine kinase n=2 Tax=Candidatus Wolfeibacteriota TaxID=1752735 RepID=A0A0G1X5F3_9BACT|nr:MAG: two-component sensor histidine kinase [Candidatus Wolfebacteria bacterium GW2011_GWB1_47_1]KKU36780.1 MAG: Histidine kinase [Candidatus Wolfebacteria bacterium GW2011_GWC2_46_275]KKU42320.1 MAG: Histidine kinase [Candidatus Wolfebacteria bacterium GW2011_GWB2_46_69]KKU53674.1 MAG: Histidine kinase [Candidatus Wolfebacteria bacterium GW2011_GWC1_47_103]KKU58919.1 MAG: Histidine kinase [Candidatus Wolfebacteria bacterium GW2011_GWE2_47_12]KKU66117.1 MAG: Histidine kinase [Candidatus Wolf